MLSNISLALLVYVEDIRAVILDHVVFVSGGIVQKLVRVLVVAYSDPLMTGEGTISSEVTSEVDFCLREVIDEILHTGLFDRGNERRNTVLITLLNNATDKRVRVSVIILGNNEGAAADKSRRSMGGRISPVGGPIVLHILSGKKRSIHLKFHFRGFLFACDRSASHKRAEGQGEGPSSSGFDHLEGESSKEGGSCGFEG